MTGHVKKWGLTLVMGVAIVFFILFGFYRRHKWKKEHFLVELKAIQTPLGWGYDILTNGRPYIHQDFIPDINGQHGFLSKDEALAVGQKVYDRLVSNQLPVISIAEMRQMGIHLPDSSNLKK
jgi:hypothetical protein